MSQSLTEQINVSNILTLNFTYIEQKLRKNFQIIAKRLSKLQGLFPIQQKIKGMQRQAKFLSMKLENVIMKIPEISMGVSPQTVKIICEQEMKEYMNSTHDNLKSTRFYHEVKDAVTRGLKDELKIPPPVTVPITLKKKDKGKKVEKVVEYQGEKVPLKYKVNREEFVSDMTKEEIHFTDKILKEDKTAEEMILEVAMRLRMFIRDYQQTRISKGSLEFVNKSLDQFDRFESYESKNTSKKGFEKDKSNVRIQRGKDNPEEYEKKLEGKEEKEKVEVKRQDKTAVKLERDSLSVVRKTNKIQQNTGSNRIQEESSRSKSNIKIDIATKHDNQFPKVQQIRTKRKSIVNDLSQLPESQQNKYNHNNVETSKRQYRSTLTKIHSKKSIVKMLSPQFELKDSDPNRNIILTLRHLQKSTDQKVNKDVFLNVIEEIEQKIESIRHAKDLSDTAEIRKFCLSIQNRMQSIIAFIQQMQEEQDPIIAKKKWSCISCDRQTEKYSARVGSHLNWDSLGGKKLSPVKAGAFGQTVMFASKIKNLINIGDIPE